MPFPETALITEFDDPPTENPLSQGGTWAQTSFVHFPMRVVAGQATDSVHGNPNYSHWVGKAFGLAPSLEVWACTEGGQLGAAFEAWYVTMWYGNPNSAFGYRASYGGGLTKAFAIRRYDGDHANFMTLVGSPPTGYPEQLGLRIIGTTLECWGRSGGVWALQCSTTDSTYTTGAYVDGPWWIGISIEDPTGGGLTISCFGGGNPNRTQIYRVLRGVG